MSAPVSHTCPLIDGVIDVIQDQLQTLNIASQELKHGNTEPCASYIEEVRSALEDLVPTKNSTFSRFLDQRRHIALEKIRDANASLREWGEGLEEDIKQAEDKISTLEAEIESLEYQLSQKS